MKWLKDIIFLHLQKDEPEFLKECMGKLEKDMRRIMRRTKKNKKNERYWEL